MKLAPVAHTLSSVMSESGPGCAETLAVFSVQRAPWNWMICHDGFSGFVDLIGSRGLKGRNLPL